MPFIDDLLDLQVPEHVSISPDGQHILYTTSTISRPKGVDHSVSTIWLAETGKQHSARPITSGQYNDISPAWRPDGRSIAFISNREHPGGAGAIYVLSLKDDKLDSLTDPENERGIKTFRWSPDGKYIAFISADERTPEQKQRAKDKDDANVWGQNMVFSRLRTVDVGTKEVATLVAGSDHVNGLAWSPEGTRIAFTHTKEPGLESLYLLGCGISVIEIDGQRVRHVGWFASAIEQAEWVGKELFFTGNVVPTVFTSAQALWSVDLDSGNPQFQRRAHGDNDCIGDIVEADGIVVVGCKQGVNERIHILDGRELATFKGNVSSFDVRISPGDEVILAAVTSSTGIPSEVFSTTVSRDTEHHVRLSSHGDVVKAYEFGTATVLECQSADKTVTLDAIYYTPAKPKGKNGLKGPFPTAVMCHGGPYNRSVDAFSPHSTSWEPVLLEAGYGVLSPNYRGSSGRGEAFASHTQGGLGTVDYDDVVTLTQLAIEKGYADKNHLLIGGWSNGGALANLASVRNGMHGLGWQFKAAIVGAGPSDHDSMRFTSAFGLVFEVGMAKHGNPWDSEVDNVDARRRVSTVWGFRKAVQKGGVVPPMLILHCENDTIVPFEQAVAIRRSLQWHGLPFEFVSYPREDHRPMEYLHVKDRLERARRWTELHLSTE